MKIKTSIALLALPLLLSSCSTPPPPQAFHKVDSTALVIDSLDDNTCQLIQPTMSDKQQNDQILTEAHNFAQHDTAVVILENYNEPQPGAEFRDRSVSLFVGLRGAGYKNIVFLQGKGVANPEGLITLAEYD
jgi:hypothetical protein